MANYVNALDVLNYSILDGGSQYLTSEDVWFWDYHLSKPHVNGNISYVPQYCLDQKDPLFVELNTSAVSENLKSATSDFYMTSDYSKGIFIFSKNDTYKNNLYYIDIPTDTVVVLPKSGVVPTTLESTGVKGKLLEYRAGSNWVLYADTADQVLYKYDVSGQSWSALKAFPTGWNINADPKVDTTLMVDQVTNDVYLMFRNMYVISTSNKTIYYNYRMFKYDVVANVWAEVLTDSSFDIYQYGITFDGSTHSTGRTMVHNGKLYVFNMFSEVYTTGARGRCSFMSFIVINAVNGAVEKNDWIPVYNQSLSCTSAVQAVRYGSYMVLITPDCPNACVMIDPITYGISYLRIAVGSAQGTNTIRCDSVFSLGCVSGSSSSMIYDPRERKKYMMAWSSGELIVDYSFDDQIYVSTIELDLNDPDGLSVYIDRGTGSYELALKQFNAQSNLIYHTITGYVKRFRIRYTIGTNNALAELYKIRVMSDPTHVWVMNSANNRLDNDQFNNIVIGTPTAPRMYKIQNKTGFTSTAVRVYIEADGDTGSFFTEISNQTDAGYMRHCTANSGTACTKGFNFSSRDCANGRCGGFERATLLVSPQALPPNQSAVFYVRVSVPSGQTRINRNARVVTQIEY